MPEATDKIPEGFSTITPCLMVKGAARAIDLYTSAFGAKEIYRMAAESGKIMHACLQIGDSRIFIADAGPELDCGGPSASSFYLYLEDVDSAHKKAVKAGLKEFYPVEDMFWGDRTGTVKDPYGNAWTLATHVRDVTDEEMEEGRQEFSKKMKQKAA